jgi:hypothetical protein
MAILENIGGFTKHFSTLNENYNARESFAKILKR